jgi:hypothetical protein
MTVWSDVQQDRSQDISVPHINGKIKIKALKIPKVIPNKVIRQLPQERPSAPQAK